MAALKFSLLLSFSLFSFSTSNKSWDYLLFVQSWAGSKCAQKTQCQVPEGVATWTIHGLWPSKIGKGPNYCNSSWKFSHKKITPILTELNKDWPNYYTNQAEDSLWKHEWEKHGTCASTSPLLNGQLKYFNQTLGLFGKYNLKKILGEDDIKPDKSKVYYLSNVTQALKTFVGTTVVVTCDRGSSKSVPSIAEVQICLNKALEPIHCNRRSNCPKKLRYPLIRESNSLPEIRSSLTWLWVIVGLVVFIFFIYFIYVFKKQKKFKFLHL